MSNLFGQQVIIKNIHKDLKDKMRFIFHSFEDLFVCVSRLLNLGKEQDLEVPCQMNLGNS